MGELTGEFLKECGLEYIEFYNSYSHPNSAINFRIQDESLTYFRERDVAGGILLAKPISKRIDFVRFFTLLTGIDLIVQHLLIPKP